MCNPSYAGSSVARPVENLVRKCRKCGSVQNVLSRAMHRYGIVARDVNRMTFNGIGVCAHTRAWRANKSAMDKDDQSKSLVTKALPQGPPSRVQFSQVFT